MNSKEKIKKFEEKSKKKLDKEKERIDKIKSLGIKNTKGFLHDFKEFATKGNVIDMAVGVVIATAFTKIVNSLVNEIITPVISIFTGKVSFNNLFIALDGNNYKTLEEAVSAGASVINYGSFITNVLDFLMIALSLFVFLKIAFSFKKKKKVLEEEILPPTTKKCPYCLSDIPIEATRCSHCTSILENSEPQT